MREVPGGRLAQKFDAPRMDGIVDQLQDPGMFQEEPIRTVLQPENEPHPPPGSPGAGGPPTESSPEWSGCPITTRTPVMAPPGQDVASSPS